MKQPKALVLVFDGVEEMEAVAPIDLLSRAGVEVTVASVSASLKIEGRNGIFLIADSTFADSQNTGFDMVVLPGGPGHAPLLDNAPLLEFLKEQDRQGKWTGSICAGPVVLDKAGILAGRRFTSFPGTREKLPNRDPESLVVKDGNLITSQGAGTATDFALALVEALCGPIERSKIAGSICFPERD